MTAYSERELQARVAWAYYNEEMTQAEIAALLDLNRVRVNKILQQCRETGMVQVIINSDQAGLAGGESTLRRTFGICGAVVVPTPARERHLPQAIGHAAGNHLSSMLRAGQLLGLGWGTTLRAGIDGIVPRQDMGVTIVSLFGGLPSSSTTNPYDVASLFSRKLGADACYYISAPMYVESSQMRDTLVSQSTLAAILARAEEVDLALIGAGDLTTKSTNLNLGAISERQWHSLRQAGAVGEVFGYFLDPAGRPVDHELNRCLMSSRLETLRDIPLKVLASGGLHKVPIIKAALAAGLVDVLVTDERTAHVLCAGEAAGGKMFLEG